MSVLIWLIPVLYASCASKDELLAYIDRNKPRLLNWAWKWNWSHLKWRRRQTSGRSQTTLLCVVQKTWLPWRSPCTCSHEARGGCTPHMTCSYRQSSLLRKETSCTELSRTLPQGSVGSGFTLITAVFCCCCCVCVFAYMCACGQVCTVCVYVHACVCVHAWVCTCVCVHMLVCVHACVFRVLTKSGFFCLFKLYSYDSKICHSLPYFIIYAATLKQISAIKTRKEDFNNTRLLGRSVTQCLPVCCRFHRAHPRMNCWRTLTEFLLAATSCMLPWRLQPLAKVLHLIR